MIEVIDLKEIRHESHDLPDLQTLLKQLIGQPFRFFRVAYGDELRVHLGSLHAYSKPKMNGRTRGSYVLGARASSWIVFSAPKATLLASDRVEVRAPMGMARRVDIKKIEDDCYLTPGTTVVGVLSERLPHGFTLQLAFADGSTVFIGPNPDPYECEPDSVEGTQEAAGMEISDWEILTPHSRVLRVGPGDRWCYLDSKQRRGE
jgi:hypothetical protein